MDLEELLKYPLDEEVKKDSHTYTRMDRATFLNIMEGNILSYYAKVQLCLKSMFMLFKPEYSIFELASDSLNSFLNVPAYQYGELGKNLTLLINAIQTKMTVKAITKEDMHYLRKDKMMMAGDSKSLDHILKQNSELEIPPVSSSDRDKSIYI